MQDGVLLSPKRCRASAWGRLHAAAMLVAALAGPVWGDTPPGTGVTRLTPVVPAEQMGPVLPIIEDDMRRTIQERFETKLPELKKQLADSIRNYRVPAFPHPTTDTSRTLLVDPTMTLENDVVGPQGQLIARAGTRINPLHTIALLRTYLVLDGSDARQIAWAIKEINRKTGRPTTLLLTDGNLATVKASVPAGTPVYPAPADLFTRFPVETVPARLSQRSDQLRIDFIAEQDLQ